MKSVVALLVTVVVSFPAGARDFITGPAITDLVEALEAVNATPGKHRILLEPHTTYVLGRSGVQSLPGLNADVTIVGNFSTIRGYSDCSTPLLVIGPDATVRLEMLTLADGGEGALLNNGSLTLVHSVLEDNRGSALASALINYGRVTLENSFIRFNSYTGNKPGGAIFNGGHLVARQSTFFANTAFGTPSRGHGSALVNRGRAEIIGSRIVDNTAPYDQGAAAIVSEAPAMLVLRDSEVRSNQPRWLSVQGGAAAIESINNIFE